MMNKVFSKTNVKATFRTIGDYTVKGIKIIVPALVMVYSNRTYERPMDYIFRCNGEPNTYGGAINAINKSSMWSKDKSKAISAIKRNEDTDYYKGIISVAKSDMWSSNVAETIINMSK